MGALAASRTTWFGADGACRRLGDAACRGVAIQAAAAAACGWSEREINYLFI
jgi:hypothetical protein